MQKFALCNPAHERIFHFGTKKRGRTPSLYPSSPIHSKFILPYGKTTIMPPSGIAGAAGAGSGMSTIPHSVMKNYDIVTITAFRSVFTNGTERCNQAKVNNNIEQGHVFSKGENLIRNKTLKQLLISYGYGVTTIYGNYIEGASGADAVEVGEQSFFVVNLPNDKNFYKNVFELSEVFNQDSFLYKPKNDDNAYLVGTNLSDFPGYGNSHRTGTLTSLPSRFMSRIKNAFVNKDNWIVKNKKSDISSDEMNDYSHDYSWREDERPTFNARKAERMEHEALTEDWRKLNASNGIMLESIKDLSRNAKMALIGITEEIKRG